MGRYQGAGQVVIGSYADKGQEFFPVCDGHGADTGFLYDYLGNLGAGFLVEAGAQEPTLRSAIFSALVEKLDESLSNMVFWSRTMLMNRLRLWS